MKASLVLLMGCVSINLAEMEPTFRDIRSGPHGRHTLEFLPEP